MYGFCVREGCVGSRSHRAKHVSDSVKEIRSNRRKNPNTQKTNLTNGIPTVKGNERDQNEGNRSTGTGTFHVFSGETENVTDKNRYYT